MARRITNEDIEKINIAYLKYHTYSGAARETGFAPTTIKKYIIENFVPKEQLQIKKFNGKIPSIDFKMFEIENWGELCTLSEEEKKEIEELWGEIIL